MKESNNPDENNPNNVELVNEAFEEASMEDKVWLFWRQYNRHILLAIALIFLGFIGFQGIGFYKERQIEKLQEDYQEAIDEGNALTFAQNNPKEPLAGTVFIQEADKLIEDKNYSEAIQFYQKALASLKNTPLADRCRLSIAITHFFNGDRNAAKQNLESLMNRHESMGTIRAEAAYQLALITLEDEDYNATKTYLDLVSRIPNAGIWGQKGSVLLDSTPGLASN